MPEPTLVHTLPFHFRIWSVEHDVRSPNVGTVVDPRTWIPPPVRPGRGRTRVLGMNMIRKVKARAVMANTVTCFNRPDPSTSRTTEADALFEKIAGQPNFYGNLADEELDRKIALPPKARATTE